MASYLASTIFDVSVVYKCIEFRTEIINGLLISQISPAPACRLSGGQFFNNK